MQTYGTFIPELCRLNDNKHASLLFSSIVYSEHYDALFSVEEKEQLCIFDEL
jgi:hypothetical protein